MEKIIDFEQFKGKKELDKGYEKFLSTANKCFSGYSPDSMLKRLYYTIRYLEGHINGLSILFLLKGITMDEQKKGVKYMIDWLEEIIKDLKGFYDGD